MPRRAAIYVRVSSERQADRVSPAAQEADALAYCERGGYTVVDVYRDIEKYRVGGRMVEPSGTRADRPQLRRMLADAGAERFDVMIAWREDRLYRSYRPMMDVMDCLEETGVDIELVKETFDKQMMGGKVWVARMELDAKHDRLMMGLAGRLEKRKVLNQPPAYGYRRSADGNSWEVEEREACWVKRICQWYAEGVSVHEIRRRLRAAGAAQRRGPGVWHISILRNILGNETYHTGTLTYHLEGETYKIFVPAIITPELAERIRARKAQYQKYPAGNLQVQALAAGKVYCQGCGIRMSVSTLTVRQPKKTYTYLRYRCGYFNYHNPGCANKMNVEHVDAEVWRKVWSVFESEGEFERLVEARIAELRAQEVDAEAEVDRLGALFDDLLVKRQQIISWAQDGKISEADMVLRLGGMDLEKIELERERDQWQLAAGKGAERLVEVLEMYRQDVLKGRGAINARPSTPSQAAAQFAARRKFVDTLVTRVDVAEDKTVKVHLLFDPAALCIEGQLASQYV